MVQKEMIEDKNKGRRLYVHEEFARMIKINAAIEGKSLLAFSEDCIKKGEFKIDKEKLKKEFEFRL